MLAYVIVRPLMTVVTTLAMLAGVYHDSSMSPAHLPIYIAIINGWAQAWALYCLVLMYQARRTPHLPREPLSCFRRVPFSVIRNIE